MRMKVWYVFNNNEQGVNQNHVQQAAEDKDYPYFSKKDREKGKDYDVVMFTRKKHALKIAKLLKLSPAYGELVGETAIDFKVAD